MKKTILALALSSYAFYAVASDNNFYLITGSSKAKVSYTNYGKCYLYDDLAVLSKKSTDDSVGEDILVKSDDITCNWDDNHGWLIDGGEASYFIGKWRDLLFVDRGTGPDFRDILIYNQENHELIYSDTYSTPIKINNNSLEYWRNTVDDNTNLSKCIEQNAQEGLSMSQQQFVKVNLLSNKLNMIKESSYRCIYLQ